MARGSSILTICIFLFSSCIVRNNMYDFDCNDLCKYKIYIGFSGFSNNELSDIIIYEKNNGIVVDTFILPVDSTEVVYKWNDSFRKEMPTEMAYSKDKIEIKLYCTYDVVIKSYNNSRLSFAIHSMKKHFMNTMLDNQFECVVNYYSINDYLVNSNEGCIINKKRLVN